MVLGVLWFVWRQIVPAPIAHGILLQSPQQATDFTLMSTTGEPVSLSDYRGKYVLLDFGYTFCPDVCPMALSDLSKATELLGDQADKTQVLFISVDPERDTPERLAAYLPYFHESFIGLTGTPEDIQQIATAYGVFFEKSSNKTTDYLIDHTATITVVDPKGYVRVLFPSATTGSEIAADLQALLR
jgi:protein SCO1/2